MVDNTIQVTICGGGNLSHFSAAVIGAQPNFKVNVFTRRPKEWKKEILADTQYSSWKNRGPIIGKINKVTACPKLACEGSSIFILGIPNNINKTILQQIAPFIPKDSFVGTCYGQGGFNLVANQVFGKDIIEKNITLFGLFNVPSICKIQIYGERIRVVGPKDTLYTAVMPQSKQIQICDLLEKMYTIPCSTIPNFVNCILTPSNQIIHPARAYGVFKDWDGQSPYDEKKLPKLYEDTDQYSADLMQAMDDEIQAIKKAIIDKYPLINLDAVEPMKNRIIRQYGDQISDKSTLCTVFRTNLGYSFLTFPLMTVKGGVAINTNSRFFTEDIPYGLCILRDIARLAGVQTPTSDAMIEWHQKFMGKIYLQNGQLNPDTLHETGAPSAYGINNLEDFLKACGIEEAQLVKPKL